MKKMLCLAAALVMMVTCAFAEEIDLDSMTTDELLALRSRINEELTERCSTDGSEIYSGRYVVGEDIAVGTYLFSFLSLVENRGCGYLTVYQSDDASEVYSCRIGEEFYLDLQDGMRIAIEDGVGSIRKTVKPDWAL